VVHVGLLTALLHVFLKPPFKALQFTAGFTEQTAASAGHVCASHITGAVEASQHVVASMPAVVAAVPMSCIPTAQVNTSHVIGWQQVASSPPSVVAAAAMSSWPAGQENGASYEVAAVS
jgi:hypothetical protein